jgi:murein L,D-transpeptidase YafK
MLGMLCCLLSVWGYAQADSASFRKIQFSSPRVTQAWQKYQDTLHNTFTRKGIHYPPYDIYLRSFKSQNEMELWSRNDDTSAYKLVKTYHVCALSGILGPKRYEGDRQVPEGCYFIEEFNPVSEYYLSMLLNYPNFSDKAIGDKDRKLGGDIYIHGGCVTVGCIPMTDPVIQELYVLCLTAKMNGQNHIPVHIYPLRFSKAGLNYLNKSYNDAAKQRFWLNLKTEYDYFEKHHRLLPVMYDANGEYVF